jgi:hypothetical protein
MCEIRSLRHALKGTPPHPDVGLQGFGVKSDDISSDATPKSWRRSDQDASFDDLEREGACWPIGEMDV